MPQAGDRIMKIRNKKSCTVVRALNRLEKKYGSKVFREKFKTITCDNGVEFLDAKGIEKSIATKQPRTTVRPLRLFNETVDFSSFFFFFPGFL